MVEDELPMNPLDQHFVCLPCLDCEGDNGRLRGEGSRPSDVGGWCCWCGDYMEADEGWNFIADNIPRGNRCAYLHESKVKG